MSADDWLIVNWNMSKNFWKNAVFSVSPQENAALIACTYLWYQIFLALRLSHSRFEIRACIHAKIFLNMCSCCANYIKINLSLKMFYFMHKYITLNMFISYIDVFKIFCISSVNLICRLFLEKPLNKCSVFNRPNYVIISFM